MKKNSPLKENKMKSSKVKIIYGCLGILVVGSVWAMAQQFFMHQKPFIHHTFVCAVILLSAAYATKFLKTSSNRGVKIAVFFALCGMSLGVFEALNVIFN